MNYGLFTADFLNTYGERYTPPYWQYTVVPRNYEQPVYRMEVDFGLPPYNELDWHYLVQDGDVLEFFILRNRVLLVGVDIEIVSPAEVVLEPVTRSGVPFNVIDCSLPSRQVLTPFNGILDRATSLVEHSMRIEEPDYLGMRIVSGALNLTDLSIIVTASVVDEFSLDTKSNSTKGT